MTIEQFETEVKSILFKEALDDLKEHKRSEA